MQARIGGRRAAPPRPTLLVGDLAACHTAFDRLQQRVLELLLAQQAVLDGDVEQEKKAVDAWRDLVPRCRALRETLTALRELSHFTREVYECAADVCLHARDFPEALKALHTLVHHIYPALAAAKAVAAEAAAEVAAADGAGGIGVESRTRLADGRLAVPGRAPAAQQQQVQQPQQQQQQSARRAAAAHTAWGSGAFDEAEDDEGSAWLSGPGAAELGDSVVAAALASPAFQRWPEAAGALVLYFTAARPAGAPPGDSQLDTLATLRRLPARLLATPELRTALRLQSALAAGDFVTTFRVQSTAPPLVRTLVSGAAAAGVRDRALVVLAAAYRNIAVGAVCRMLALGAPRHLLACLKLLADRGHPAAGRALSALQQEEPAALAGSDVLFKG